MPQTAVAGNVRIEAIRIVVKISGCTQCRLQIPLLSTGYNASNTVNAAAIEKTESLTYVQSAGNAYMYTRWAKTAGANAPLSSGNPWTFEAVLAQDSTYISYAQLYNLTDSQPVTNSQISVTTGPDVVSVASFVSVTAVLYCWLPVVVMLAPSVVLPVTASEDRLLTVLFSVTAPVVPAF